MNHQFPYAMPNTKEVEHSISVVGYRFHPTDDELVSHFLKCKTLGHHHSGPPIPEIKLCDFEPWDLPAVVNKTSEEQVWYFFCPRDYKYLHSYRSNRTTKAGYWKPTGKPRKVKAMRTKEEIGTKRSLVFYVKDHPKPTRTKWIMHEYACIPNTTLPALGNFFLCKLKSKQEEKIIKERPSHPVSTLVLENQNSNETAATSSSNEYEIRNSVDFDFENGGLATMTAMSTYDISEKSFPVQAIANSVDDESKSSRNCLGSKIDIRDSNEITAMSTYDKSERSGLTEVITISAGDESESSRYCLDFETETQDPSGITAMSTYDEVEKYCLGNSDGNESESSRYCMDSKIENPNEVTNMSTCETVDFDSQNLQQISDISEVSQEGEFSPQATPSENTEISISPINSSTASLEVNSMDAYYNLEAMFQLEDNLNAALFPPMSTEGNLCYTRFDTSYNPGVAGIY